MTVVASHSFADMMPTQQQQQGSAGAAEPKLHWLLVPGGVGESQCLHVYYTHRACSAAELPCMQQSVSVLAALT
jgi:hypothetical protein